MNEWTNERMNEWTNERMNEWTNERMNEWTNEQMNEWMNAWCMHECTSKCSVQKFTQSNHKEDQWAWHNNNSFPLQPDLHVISILACQPWWDDKQRDPRKTYIHEFLTHQEWSQAYMLLASWLANPWMNECIIKWTDENKRMNERPMSVAQQQHFSTPARPTCY